MSAEDLLLAQRVVIRTARPRPPRIKWWSVLAVAGSALAFFVWKGWP